MQVFDLCHSKKAMSRYIQTGKEAVLVGWSCYPHSCQFVAYSGHVTAQLRH